MNEAILTPSKAARPPKPRTKEDFQVKYKTEICRNFINGNCKFGDNCAFAHGYNEIKQKTHVPKNFKTAKCKQFFEFGYCMYGYRCQFSHQQQPKTRDSTPPPHIQTGERRRLPVFIKLTSMDDELLQQVKTFNRIKNIALPAYSYENLVHQKYVYRY